MALPKDWKEFIGLLNAHRVEYVLVGAFAFAYHAHPRFTGDLDVLVRRTPENAGRVTDVLKEFGFASIGITSGDLLTPGRVVQLGVWPVRIDILSEIDGVSFDEIWAGRQTTTVDDLTVAVIGRAQFIRNKKASGRLKDLRDLEALGMEE
jgi:hypothetical protein